MTMDDMSEEQRIQAAKIRDRAAAAAQGDSTAWAHLLDVIHAPDARVKALEGMTYLLSLGTARVDSLYPAVIEISCESLERAQALLAEARTALRMPK